MRSKGYLTERAKILLALKELDEKFIAECDRRKEADVQEVVGLMEKLGVTFDDVILEFARRNLLAYQGREDEIRKLFLTVIN